MTMPLSFHRSLSSFLGIGLDFTYVPFIRVCTLFHSFMKQMLNLCYRDSEIPENLARDVIKTYKIVQNAVSKIL